ncbi:protein draper [Zerene cesonia]|uniref:protein draper n=1 Tax=Zerene cesonia TaxID=33412 RepID=UPI0018E51688|nr:protein draper [Zerene cesonia]
MWKLVLLALVVAGDALLEGPNVCTRQEAYTTTIRVSEQQPYQVKEYAWCLSVPPRCSKYKVKFRQVYKTQTLVKQRPVEECCKGYAPDARGEQCVPVCVEQCVRGKCVAPDTCACEHGYGGPACDISCPSGKWGRNCQNSCRCMNGGTCEPLTGECACAGGWRGDACERPCERGTFGDACRQRCQCANNATCDAASGKCECQPGYTGALCEEECPKDQPCPERCKCQNNGACNIATGECECTPGWTGEVCANTCPSGLWGHNCSRTCECANGASCHHVTGQCQCEAGFTGDKCLDICPAGTFGAGCAGRCACRHGGACEPRAGACACRPGWAGAACERRACPDGRWGPRCDRDCECNPHTTELCDPWSGACACAAGWAGDACDRQCPLLTYGKGCRGVCRCENSAHCSPVNGSCLCAPGYRGVHCAEACPQPLYGDNCADSCDCRNNATCSHETGECRCPPGFDGLKCDRPCDGKTFGLGCRQPCDCENDAPCNPVTGECVCGPGYTGPRCAARCPPGTYGANCSLACDCAAHALACHHVTGRCLCDTSWRGLARKMGLGVRCETQCPPGLYGEGCASACACANNSSCEAASGRCVCAAGWRGAACDLPCEPGRYGAACAQLCPKHVNGNTTCDPVTGKSVCPSGYTGVTCEYPCPLGTYGPNCEGRCDCRNGADCHHVTGECQCLPGWQGARCAAACGAGQWGAGCSQPCRCARGAACRPNDGYCRCPPGFTGTYCTQFCPEGYFGDHCMEACNCSSSGHWTCDPVRGCVCARGYIGDACELHASDAITVAQTEGTSRGAVAGMVVVSGACVCVAALLLLHYRRRVRLLKREIAHVHYSATPPPDQQHFDNPVYSFQSSNRSDDSSTLLNNAPQIINNLATPKLSNTAMEKLRMTATGSNGSYDPMSLKNKDADATNPNLYHCIDDDNKLDHVYDEIKHKEGYEMEYDHLNYTPPANTWKAHYQRMNDTLPSIHKAVQPDSPTTSEPTQTPPIPPLPKVSGSFYDELQGAMHSVQHGFGKLLSDVVYDVTDTVHCTISAVEHVLTLNGLIKTKSMYGHRCRDGPLPPIETRDDDPLENFLRTRDALEEQSFGEAAPNLLHTSIERVNRTLSHALDNRESQRKIDSISKVLKDETEQLTKVSNILRQELNSISQNVNTELNNLESSVWTERRTESKNSKPKNNKPEQSVPVDKTDEENDENNGGNQASDTYNEAKQEFEHFRDQQTDSNDFPTNFRDVARNIRGKSYEDSTPKNTAMGSVFDVDNGNFDQFSPFFDPGTSSKGNHKRLLQHAASIIEDSQRNEQIMNKVFKESHTAADIFNVNPEIFNF